MTNDATSPRIKERPIKKMLRCDLTEKEKAELAATMAEDQAKLESLEDEKRQSPRITSLASSRPKAPYAATRQPTARDGNSVKLP